MKGILEVICLSAILLMVQDVPAQAGSPPSEDARLRKDIVNPDQEIRRAATDTLVHQGVLGVPILVNALSDPVLVQMISVQEEGMAEGWEVADALSRIGNPAVPALLNALKNPVVAVRAQAATALGNMKPPRTSALAPLATLLHDLDPWVRTSVANAIGKYHSAAKPVVTKLVAALNDRDRGVRIWVCSALGNIGQVGAPALPTLRRALSDSDAGVREAAQRAIEVIENRP